MVMLSRSRKWLFFVFCLLGILLLGGCSWPGQLTNRSGIRFSQDKMLHLQQILEHYDAAGDPVPQYLELWLTRDRGRCDELSETGLELAVSLDTGRDHLNFNPATLTAEKSDASRLFIVNFAIMKKLYPQVRQENDGEYAGRPCRFYWLDSGDENDWVKIYLDKETQYVLFCDAATFRLRTALIEELPLDASLFEAPAGLVYDGGNG